MNLFFFPKLNVITCRSCRKILQGEYKYHGV
jgi:hypothetical protein